jgi:hypothetical protein
MATTSNKITGVSAGSHAQYVVHFDLYYQNVRGLRTKQFELYSNICSTYYNILCLTETWLNDSCFDHNLFPDSYTVFCSDRVSGNKTRGGGMLTALSSRIHSFKRRYDLESCDECVWIEISTLDSINLLIGNHYFPLIPNPKSLPITFTF